MPISSSEISKAAAARQARLKRRAKNESKGPGTAPPNSYWVKAHTTKKGKHVPGAYRKYPKRR